MTTRERVGLIGHGGIVRAVLDRLPATAGTDVAVTDVLCRPGRATAARAVVGDDIAAVETIDELLAARPTIVAECAGHGAVADYGEAVLAAGIDLLVASTGALADQPLHERLAGAAVHGGARLVLPAGAIGAIDALAAGRIAGLERVRYRSRKPPAAWAGSAAETACDLASISEPTVFFRGDARTAARDYPKNANVAATVALAGLGFERAEVELCADPAAAGNIHEVEVEAEGTAGRFRIELLGFPGPDNPRTSQLTAMSIVRALANRAAAVVI